MTTNKCQWCDPTPGGRLAAELRLISGPNKGEIICEGCWEAHNQFGPCVDGCKVSALTGG